MVSEIERSRMLPLTDAPPREVVAKRAARERCLALARMTQP
jgi:hypothetical protein